MMMTTRMRTISITTCSSGRYVLFVRSIFCIILCLIFNLLSHHFPLLLPHVHTYRAEKRTTWAGSLLRSRFCRSLRKYRTSKWSDSNSSRLGCYVVAVGEIEGSLTQHCYLVSRPLRSFLELVSRVSRSGIILNTNAVFVTQFCYLVCC